MKKPAIAAACLLAAFFTITAAAQTLAPALKPKVDAVFKEYDSADSPGCALGIYEDGKIAYAHGYGMASLENSVPITPQTIFDLGSTSKQFTAYSILLLEREGKLSVDNDIRRFLPEMRQYQRTITIADLLHHTSGLRDYLTLWALAGVPTENWTTDEQALQLILRQKATNFTPGSEYLYSNSGFFLLSEVVKRASGKTLREYALEHIFTPLGMKHTFHLDDHRKVIPHRATGYDKLREGGFGVDMSNFEQTGDGAVQTSVEDLLLWDNNFYAPKVGDAEMLKRLQTRGRLTDGEVLDYADGLVIGKYRGQPRVSHGGSWAGYRAELMRFPEQHTSFAVLCNLGNTNPSRLAEQVADVVLADKLQPEAKKSAGAPAAGKPQAGLESYEGIYENAATGELRRIFVREGKLAVGAGGGRTLNAVGPGEFEIPNAGVRLVFAGNGEMRSVPDSGKPSNFRRLAPAKSADLSAYPGAFYSDELDTNWTFSLSEGRLVATQKNGEKMPLLQASDDLFMTDRGLRVHFERDGGRVVRAVVGAGRVRDLVFARVEGK